ncbi:hypothetical protein BDN71DRAFT_1451386 [Pleurotus eryngii]|uniref:Uncharacterized protein n=1 Tax=Pleurotus eryngii TaxID=5323 RepID=A0A9P6D4P6_PLEER|nr:hypothetical protein BDN71DRAFT_1451386 [Pleurotus eryngii]
MSSPLLSASPLQLPSDGPVPASRRNNQPFSNPRVTSRAFSFVYPEPIISRTRLHSQQSTERISRLYSAIDHERVHSSQRLNISSPHPRARPSNLQPADGRSTARRPCAYRGAYLDIDVNTSGFPPSTR